MPESEVVEFQTPLRQRVIEPIGPTRRMVIWAEKVAIATPPIAGLAALLFRPEVLDAGHIAAGLLITLGSLGAHYATDRLFRTRTTYYVGDTSDEGPSLQEVASMGQYAQQRGDGLVITSDKARPSWENH